MWVFGYGSLIWNPGFPVADRQIATLHDWQRSFCMRSIHHRGTVAAMGLVLALDRVPGARCAGVAFAVAADDRDQTLAGLRERELISSAYMEAWLPVTLADGRVETALAYVINPDHDQYCGGLALDEQARIIAVAHGGRGSNRDYLNATAAHLRDLGIGDPELDLLVAKVAQLPA
jgi:cation transport protein ChaC